MHEAVIAIAKEGVSPIVRIPANEAWMVKRKWSLFDFNYSTVSWTFVAFIPAVF